jgi:D-alanyl-D-alanine carboxypeptidase
MSSFFINSTQQVDNESSTIDSAMHFNNTIYKNISAEINSVINKYKIGNTRYGITIYSSKMNKCIYTHNPQTLLVPASNTKLITTFTTYNLLKNDQNVKTRIAIDGEIINGLLNGNLYIIGGGDALLSVNDLEIIADEIKMYGINKINGNIIGDDTFFDNIYDRFHYSGDEDEVEPTASVSALSIEKNVVNVIITSGANIGKLVNVSFKPASSGFAVSNSAIISSKNPTKIKKEKPRKVKIKTGMNNIFELNEFKQTAGDISLAAKRKTNLITISSNIDSMGKQIFYIKGTLPPNRTYSYKVFIKNSALIVACALRDRLISGGISVTGKAIKKSVPENKETKIIYTFYRNINELINVTNKKSDNYLAENLFKLNGAIFNKDKNTTKSASMAALQTLNNNKININGFVFNDGSGLSRRNLITAEGLMDLLIKSTQYSFANDFINSLSIAGYDGTLCKRMRGSFAEGNLRGKTGTHKNISSLAGVMKNRSDDTIFFAFIFNGSSVGVYKRIENEISMLLSEK